MDGVVVDNAGGPLRLRVARRVDAPADAVWDVLVSVAEWPDWGPSVTAVEAPGEGLGPGTRGSVRTVGGLRLPFEVTGFVPGRYWSWKVGGVTATDHLVEPLGPDACRLSFGVPAVAFPYLLVCRVAIGRIARKAVAG